jgi:hypothetical protein
MYSERAIFKFPNGVTTSTQFAFLSKLALVCERIPVESGLPAFQIEVGRAKCTIFCYRPDKWQAAILLLEQAQLQGEITIIRPRDP